jgi:hypothetical protein
MNSLRRLAAAGPILASLVLGILISATSNAAIVNFNVRDVALFSGAPPADIVVTTGQLIPGGIDNSAAGNEFNRSFLRFDIDGDLDPLAPDQTVFTDFQVRTATFVGGQIVFDGFTHVFPPAPQNGSYVVTKNENSYLNFPFFESEIIGDGVDEFVRDGFSPPGPPNNNTFSVALDEGGAVRFFAEGVDNFVGFRLASGNYGWIRVQFDPTAGDGDGSLTFIDGAYDNTGAPIAAGDQGTHGPASADFDGDGDADGQDFLTWQKGLGTTGTATPTTGDADGDLAVNRNDLRIWKSRFGGSPAVAAAASIPEPAAISLSLPAVALLLVRKRR